MIRAGWDRSVVSTARFCKKWAEGVCCSPKLHVYKEYMKQKSKDEHKFPLLWIWISLNCCDPVLRASLSEIL